MNIYSIGFTQKSAEKFFKLISENNIQTLIDVRLNNTSQLSGFAKRDDLKYFLKELCNCEYIHIPDLAPTKEILKPYQDKKITWQSYEEKFLDLMAKRNIEKYLKESFFYQGCLLCSEHLPHQCHRRLVLEYLKQYNNSIQANHLIVPKVKK
ncbi:DUF488 domain-containing protein [Moraxella catarrhalis]|uniref:DUF488 domain-containing protein n=2 Tax=Moraxella catarrhalis TaxID=480 RepID=UPI0009C2E896|nr:DUF488 domain-containing protein [Moraxella catarrhalis]ARE66264.1 hypothetical protein MC195_05875 [Moraxella catarrhalis]MCG6817464.1 DUF488 domain-containing protein [Moraxella catarrhalis]MPW65283.1 DUF488 domain-containing protein [Moraxella catarrhalis]MPX44495.1 DUF488 domain-containing protein [Moraxella catarrhalis]RKM05362.1 DUF488 domain-containing protein [Moraxella catarrhalis]